MTWKVLDTLCVVLVVHLALVGFGMPPLWAPMDVTNAQDSGRILIMIFGHVGLFITCAVHRVVIHERLDQRS